MTTWVLRHDSLRYCVLLYGRPTFPELDDIRDVLVRHGVTDFYGVTVARDRDFFLREKRRRPNAKRARGKPKEDDAEKKWREECEREEIERKRQREHSRRYKQKISGDAGSNSVDARDRDGGAAGSGGVDDRETGRSAGGHGESTTTRIEKDEGDQGEVT